MNASNDLITPEVRSWIGHRYPDRRLVVTELQIQRFSYSTGEANPVHFDGDAARAAGYPDVVAPPTFYVMLRTAPYHTVPLAQLGRDGYAAEDLPPIPWIEGMAGEDRVELGAEIIAGDTIVVAKRIVDLYGKRGRSGPLAFVVFEYEMTKSSGERAVLEQFTRVLR